jgi:septal ring factor EnvC (AmiA/AmiB activator)
MKLNKLFLFILFIVSCSAAFAQTAKELTRKKEALERQIVEAQNNLKKTVNGKKLTLGQINAIKAQIRLRQEKISTINSEIKNLDQQITVNTGKVQNLKTRLSDLKKEYAGMIRFAQRNRNSYDKMMFIFASSDFNQAYKRIKYLQQFGQYRKKQAAYIEGTEKELSNQIVVLDQSLKSKSSLLKEEVNEKIKLDKNKNEQTVVLSRLSNQEKQFNQDIQKKRQQQAAIQRQFNAEIQRQFKIAREKEEAEERERVRIAAAKAKAENKPVPTTATAVSKPKTNSEVLRATPEAAKLSASFESNRGSLPSPVANGYITAKFGTFMVGQANDKHEGVTYQTSENASVRAVFTGVVSIVFEKFGKYFVMIKHGEYFTIYENLASVSVKNGDNITTKQNIGVAGKTDGIPEVGFQVRRGANAQNPESWIAR